MRARVKENEGQLKELREERETRRQVAQKTSGGIILRVKEKLCSRENPVPHHFK